MRLLPTPRAAEAGQSMTAPAAMAHVESGNGSLSEPIGYYLLPTPRATRGDSSTETTALLPTPVADNSRGLPSTGTVFQSLPNEVAHRWGDYAAAIARHEQAVGRPAPAPTELGHEGNPRLAARFVEWMQMLPDGWITNVPGVTRTQALKMLGNGVVAPQCAAALRGMLNRNDQEVAA